MKARRKRVETVLVCTPIGEPVVPETEGRPDACGRRGRPIWVSHSSPSADLRWCVECAVGEAKKARNARVAAPTEAQLADVERWRAARGKPQ